MPAPAPGREGGYVLAVDLGSSGLKLGVVAATGQVVGWTYAPLCTEHGPGGRATQDAEQWWRLVADATRRVLAAAPVPGDRVGAVCVTGQWASTVPVDAAGLPVGPCLMWMDTQGGPHSRALVGGHLQGYRPAALASWVRRTGGVPSTSGADPVGHMLHLDRDEPARARSARWYLEPVDYLSMRFSGIAAATPASMTAAWLTDNRDGRGTSYDDVLVGRAGIDPARLPPLVPTGTVLGPVLPTVAAELGISPDAVVVTGIPDLHATAVGAGCVRDHETHLAIGTTGWVSCPVPYKKTDLFHQMVSVPGLAPGRYLLANNQETAGRCLQWFRDRVLGGTGAAPPGYDAITDLAASVEAGSGGVIFTPWLAGERSPVDDHSARGGFHNLSLASDRAHLARAVLEGVAYNARWLLQGAEHFTRHRLEPIRLVGGGAQSPLWCRIVADVCDRTVEPVHEPLLAGLRGAALFAAMALGELAVDDVRDRVAVQSGIVPDPAHRAVYDRLFAEFPRLYRAQRRTFARLNR